MAWFWSSRTTIAAILLTGSLGAAVAKQAWHDGAGNRKGVEWDPVVKALNSGWTPRPVKQMPAPVNSLLVDGDPRSDTAGYVFAGLVGSGDIHRFSPLSKVGASLPVATGLGDEIRFGKCYVNRMEFLDLDGDGRRALLASTSQPLPQGRPRLCAWSVNGPQLLPRGIARPEIRSNWSHAIGVHPRGHGEPVSLFVTFCGFGEIVEYRSDAGSTDDGFHHEALNWKQVGQLPASGEWLQVADADNDGRPEVCVATGYAANRAAIMIYASDSPGSQLRQVRRIDEGNRFGNVRFVVTRLDGEKREILAWWMTGPDSGNCELIRYRLGPGGVEKRAVIALAKSEALWADDGKFLADDLDSDGRPEVWYSTSDQSIWRYDPGRSVLPERVVQASEPLGPIASGPISRDMSDQRRLYIGSGPNVLVLDPLPATKPVLK